MATVKADGPVTTLQLSRVRVIELLGDLTDLIRQNFNVKVGAAPLPGAAMGEATCRHSRSLNRSLRAVTRRYAPLQVLGGVEMFKALEAAEMDALVAALQEVSFSKGESIIRQGERGDSFYILKSGTVKVQPSPT